MPTPARIEATTKEIVERLVAGDYAGLESRTRGVRLSANEMRNAIRQYGRQLRMPPDDSFRSLDVVEVRGSDPKAWSVVCPLWTDEEGRSDLSLELTMTENGDDMRVELDDLHVR